jgi:hypothetical protein
VIRGSCLCGEFRFEIRGPILFLKNCHCSRCRKMTGSAFATYARANTDTLAVLSGADGIITYERCPGNVIAFCRRCGSIVPHPPENSAQVEFFAGLLDDPPGVGVAFHIYVSSRAPWHEIDDELPQFGEQTALRSGATEGSSV